MNKPQEFDCPLCQKRNILYPHWCNGYYQEGPGRAYRIEDDQAYKGAKPKQEDCPHHFIERRIRWKWLMPKTVWECKKCGYKTA